MMKLALRAALLSTALLAGCNDKPQQSATDQPTATPSNTGTGVVPNSALPQPDATPAAAIAPPTTMRTAAPATMPANGM